MIPFLDLAPQHRPIEQALFEAARSVMASGHFVLGEHNAAFEAAFAAFCGAEHAITVNSGASALHLALLAAGVGPGDEVITVSSTFVATVAAVEYTGATPVLVDIDPDRWTMDPTLIEAAITPRTKAILPVHLHGRLADMDRIMQIARSRGLLVIEDAAQAHGAELAGRRAGAIGDLGCFSFYPGKNLGGCGEGGAVTTDNAALAEAVRRLRDWGQERKYLHVRKGFNARMDEIQAAILNVKLPHLEAWTAQRRTAAAHYDRVLGAAGIAHPARPSGLDHVYHVYAVRVAERDAVRTRLAPRVATNIHYPIPVHLQPAYANLGNRPGDFPVTERLAQETLSLPMFPGMTEAQVDTVCSALIEAGAAMSNLEGRAA